MKQSFFSKPAFGMVHLRALPGTPAYDGDFQDIIDQALSEALTYVEAGMDGIILENMHDLPYLNKEVGPEITAAMTVAADRVRQAVDVPIGLQILAGANKEALAVAKAANLNFIRAEGFVFGHVADEGWINAQAGELLRYRKQIDAEDVQVFTDIKKKHSAHAITADVDLIETAEAAAFFRSDGLVITGTSTGKTADLQSLQALRSQTSLPVLVGSGITTENIASYFPIADGFIVGSSLKKEGRWNNAVDPQRVAELVTELKRLKSES